jgi:antiviral helicase SKI2
VSSGLTSTSLTRAPAPATSFVRGKSGYVPFWPGGLEDPLVQNGDLSVAKGLRTVAPGLSRGLRLPGESVDDDELMALEELQGSNHLDDAVSLLHIFTEPFLYNLRHPGH